MKDKGKSILSQSGWWMVNKEITREIGLDASVLLSDLLSKYEYFEKRGMLENGTFFNKRDDLQKDTTIPLYRQNKAIEILVKKKLISVTNKGVPPKTRFRVNILEINKLISKVYELGDDDSNY